MAEWSIALPWKGSNWVTGSGVRIPVSPPFIDDSELSVNITLMNSKYIQQLSNILQMLENIDHDLNLVGYNETEKKIFYTIANNIHTNNQLEHQIPPAPNTKPQIYTSPEKLASWSVEEVIKWIESLPLSEEQNVAWKPLIIKYFTEEEIDGEEFDLVTLKILKKKFKRAGLDDPELAAKIILEFRDASKESKNNDPISFNEKTASRHFLTSISNITSQSTFLST